MQEQEMKIREVNLEMQVARQEAEDRRAAEARALQAESQKAQADTQEKTAEVLEKSLGSTLENRQRTKTEIPMVKGATAIDLVFELHAFGDVIEEMQVDPSMTSTKWRGFKGAFADGCGGKGIVEELLAMNELKLLLSTDMNDDYIRAKLKCRVWLLSSERRS